MATKANSHARGKGRLLVKRTNELILGGWERISLRVWNDVPTEGREGMKTFQQKEGRVWNSMMCLGKKEVIS